MSSTTDHVMSYFWFILSDRFTRYNNESISNWLSKKVHFFCRFQINESENQLEMMSMNSLRCFFFDFFWQRKGRILHSRTRTLHFVWTSFSCHRSLCTTVFISIQVTKFWNLIWVKRNTNTCFPSKTGTHWSWYGCVNIKRCLYYSQSQQRTYRSVSNSMSSLTNWTIFDLNFISSIN